jgi:hypothetical protein
LGAIVYHYLRQLFIIISSSFFFILSSFFLHSSSFFFGFSAFFAAQTQHKRKGGAGEARGVRGAKKMIKNLLNSV